MAYYNPLPERIIVNVSGQDAESFLQGLVTNDVERASTNKALFAAMLSPQGKFLHDFFIVRREKGFWLETAKESAEALLGRFQQYKLRADVDFELLPEITVAALWGDGTDQISAQGDETLFQDPRLAKFSVRVWQPTARIPENAVMTKLYHKHRIQHGIPDATLDLVADKSLILEYGYDEMGAISYSKGCYVGQEVTARMKHRGTLHKFIHVVESDEMLPEPGSSLGDGKRSIGELRGSERNLGLALLRVADAKRMLMHGLLGCGNVKIKKSSVPAWCTTTFSDTSL